VGGTGTLADLEANSTQVDVQLPPRYPPSQKQDDNSYDCN